MSGNCQGILVSPKCMNPVCDLDIPREKWLNYLQTVKTDQTPRTAASDLGLHCLSNTL